MESFDQPTGWQVGDDFVDDDIPDPAVVFADLDPQPLEVPDEEEVVETDPYAGFSPQIREDVQGLELLGYLEDQFSFCGHHFTIRTLHGIEDLAAARAVQPYRGTLREPEAWMWAQVGMCLSSVDGEVNFCPPIGPDMDEFAQARFRYAASKWFTPLAEYIFRRYRDLQDRQVAAFEALQSKSLRNR